MEAWIGQGKSRDRTVNRLKHYAAHRALGVGPHKGLHVDAR